MDQTDDEKIEQYIKERGVTRYPPGYAAASQAADNPWVQRMKQSRGGKRHLRVRRRRDIPDPAFSD